MKEEEFFDTKGVEGLLDPVIPDMRQWPIYRINRDRKKLIEKVSRQSFQQLLNEYADPTSLRDLIADTYYQERIRIKETPWKTDPEDDSAFWGDVRKRLRRHSQLDIPPEQVKTGLESLLQDIIGRYTREITGNFKISSFKFAKKATTFSFSRLFYAATEGVFKGLMNPEKNPLLEKIMIKGELEKIRKLSTKGTIILVPTHISNLDSLVVGWGIEAIGLPAFTYGAGINLYGHPIMRHFMSNLGAFKVDRRKKNKVYLTTLKLYTETVIHFGCHTLFFPGGTRSRSGHIETRLKLGLLGTAFDAQRLHATENPDNPKKIFVLPLIISYHFVLEAMNLINDHLKRTAKSHFYLLQQDDFNNLAANLRFIWKFFSTGSEMMLSFGEPFDLFGNPVDEEGNSLDKQGKKINVAGYFKREGEIVKDPQRESEYTRQLGKLIQKRFFSENVVFSSQVLAYSAFNYFKNQYRGLDIYEFLRIPAEEFSISKPVFEKEVTKVLDKLKRLRESNRVCLANNLDGDLDSILKHGFKHLGGYHGNVPLALNKEQEVVTSDLKLLYFYHNRLEGYGLNI